MNNKSVKNIVILILFVILLSSIVSAETTTLFYDDFSGNTLDITKWNESTDLENLPLLDIYLLNTTEQAYHTEAFTQEDRTILLSSIRKFSPNETLEYDVDLKNSSGNILSRPTINGKPLDLMLANVCNGFATCGNIGFWNGESEVGNSQGRYHVKVDFFENLVNVTFVNPNNSEFTYTSIQPLTPQFTFGVSTRTGNNGQGHFDYDSFNITVLSQTSNQTNQNQSVQNQTIQNNSNLTISQVLQETDSRYLNFSGSNANSNINIGIFNFTANRIFGVHWEDILNKLIETVLGPYLFIEEGGLNFNETVLNKTIDQRIQNQSSLTMSQVLKETDLRHLNLSGSNANSNINIGIFNLTANRLFGVQWTDIANKFIESVSSIYLFMEGTTLKFNETVLNKTIDQRIAINSQPIVTEGPYLINDLGTLSINETVLNKTIGKKIPDFLPTGIYGFCSQKTVRKSISCNAKMPAFCDGNKNCNCPSEFELMWVNTKTGSRETTSLFVCYKI